MIYIGFNFLISFGKESNNWKKALRKSSRIMFRSSYACAVLTLL